MKRAMPRLIWRKDAFFTYLQISETSFEAVDQAVALRCCPALQLPTTFADFGSSMTFSLHKKLRLVFVGDFWKRKYGITAPTWPLLPSIVLIKCVDGRCEETEDPKTSLLHRMFSCWIQWAQAAIPQWEKRRLITPDTEKCLRLVYLCTGWQVSNKVASLPRGKLWFKTWSEGLW